MGKWSSFRDLEGQYFVDQFGEVIRLKRYMFQDYYRDENEKKVWVRDLENVFPDKERALALSKQIIAENSKREAQHEEEVRLEKEQANKLRETSSTYEHELGVPQGGYAEDAGIYGWDLD